MSTAAKKARRTLLGLAFLLFSIAGILAFNVVVKDKTWTPGLALDLAGGREIVLQASNEDGSVVDPAQLAEAVRVIRDRVDGTGVAESEITTLGQDYIKVSLPGTPAQGLLDLVKNPAQLQFRPVIYADEQDPASTTLPALLPSEDPYASITDGKPSSFAFVTDEVRASWAAIDCTQPQATDTRTMGDPDKALVACNETSADSATGPSQAAKYVLGPVEVEGGDITKAVSGPNVGRTGNVSSNQYQVAIEFNGRGSSDFGTATTRLFALRDDSTRYRFAMVLDGAVISAPGVQTTPITDGRAQITREVPAMLRAEAELLANQLKYGALPLQMTEISDQTVSATLGRDSLQKGLLAGGFGLLLVVLYSLLQYRALALVTVGSLVIAGALTMGIIGVMSAILGYRLSLAGVAGLIVSIGITADSFIIYFERVRDALREGRTLPAAIEHGWMRARRTVFASDAVSLLAAVALYVTAVGGVRGFAFTLGLTTVIDLIVVTRFTHPVLILLGTTKFFGGGHRFSGLDPRLLGRGGGYKGRGRVEVGSLTLAERKAAATRGNS